MPNARASDRRKPRFSGCPGPRRHPREQARRRRGDAARTVQALADLVAGGSPVSPANETAAAQNHKRRRLVRGPSRPELQPAGKTFAFEQRGSSLARRSSLRPDRRARPQHAAPHSLSRQRGLHSFRTKRLHADRGMCCAETRRFAEAAFVAWERLLDRDLLMSSPRRRGSIFPVLVFDSKPQRK